MLMHIFSFRHQTCNQLVIQALDQWLSSFFDSKIPLCPRQNAKADIYLWYFCCNKNKLTPNMMSG